MKLLTEEISLTFFVLHNSIAVFAILHNNNASVPHSVYNPVQRDQIGWIRVDRYLLCACQHGNTSSVDSTGTGSCGAGQSDTLCSS